MDAFTGTGLASPDHRGRRRDGFRRQDDGRRLLASKHPIAEGFSPHGRVPTVLLPSQAGVP
jgi:hypothetical protein